MVLAELIDSETMAAVAFSTMRMDLDGAQVVAVMDDDASQAVASSVAADFASIVWSRSRNSLNTLNCH
jgi:hypothetical protein